MINDLIRLVRLDHRVTDSYTSSLAFLFFSNSSTSWSMGMASRISLFVATVCSMKKSALEAVNIMVIKVSARAMEFKAPQKP